MSISLKQSFFNAMLRFSAVIVNIITPGAGLMLIDRWRLAVIIQLFMLIPFVFLCWFRLIFEPISLQLFFVYIGFIYFVSTILCMSLRTRNSSSFAKKVFAVCAFVSFAWAFLVFGFIYKDAIFGFNVYFVPSMSMYPSLKPGQFILIDTWCYREHAPKLNDMVVLKHQNSDQWLVKRISLWLDGELLHKNEWFVTGDNQNFSIDSRKFGGIKRSQFAGQVKMVLLAVDQNYNVVGDGFLE
ncbi:MAG: S26 family signal peptidase, partial [Candidatus Thiodiazotropha sp.]